MCSLGISMFKMGDKEPSARGEDQIKLDYVGLKFDVFQKDKH